MYSSNRREGGGWEKQMRVDGDNDRGSTKSTLYTFIFVTNSQGGELSSFVFAGTANRASLSTMVL